VLAPSAVDSVDRVMCETVPLISPAAADTSPTLRDIRSVVADCCSTAAAAMVRWPSSICVMIPVIEAIASATRTSRLG
jgi:hypothetical protein